MSEREVEPTDYIWQGDFTPNLKDPPTFVSSTGAKMWLCVGWTKATKRKIGPEYSVWVGEQPSGMREYVLFKGDEPVFSSQQMEGIGCHQDAIYLSQNKMTNTANEPQDTRGGES